MDMRNLLYSRTSPSSPEGRGAEWRLRIAESRKRWLTSASVVVDNRAVAVRILDERVAARLAQEDVEILIPLLFLVPLDRHGEGPGCLVGVERQVPGRGQVVFAGLGAAV